MDDFSTQAKLDDTKARVTYRAATPDDAADILEIYAPFVENTAITFECDVPTLEEFRSRLERISEHYPFLVAETDEKIGGYAYASSLFERAAYAHTCELSVYLDSALQNRGVGRCLCTRLLTQLEKCGFHAVVSRITVPNEASIRLHEALGFEQRGVLVDVGHKLGKWHDVALYEKLLSPPA